jgi:hypothetical protein
MVNLQEKAPATNLRAATPEAGFNGRRILLLISPGVLLLCGFPALAQSRQQSPGPQGAATQEQLQDPQLPERSAEPSSIGTEPLSPERL